ncbi:MAG: hypothetical protein OZ921_21375, partial [Sorangiineae bacterium]|nr:hypothetical protein [Sorangiineae bacterium]
GALAFEQAIGLGSLLGWGGAFGYLRWVRRGDAVGAPRAPLAAFGVGALVGAACPLVLALIARGSLAGFAECAIGDWLALRDGPLAMAAGLTSYAIMQRGAFPSSLAATCLAVAIGWRVIRREGSLHVASSAAPRCSLRAATGAAALASLVFGVASALFATYARLPQGVISLGAALSLAPAFGFVFAVASFVMQLPRAAKSLAPEQRRAGASVNALILAALVESVFLPLSFSTLPEGRFGFAALTPLALTFLFLYAARTGWRWLPPVVFAVTGLGLFGPHLARLLDTDTRVSSGFWAGLAVNVRGRELLDAARRLDALAAPGDRVLVLPEDAELSLLFARRRPALRGGSVQVARYPARLVPADLAVLEASPPRFIVLYPRRTMLRKALFSLTPGGVGADAFADGATALVARRYRLVGRFRVTYVWDQDELAIFELNEGEREARP